MLHSIRFEEPVATDSPSADPRMSGYDAQSSEYEDMVKAGIIGPIKVMRAAAGRRFSRRAVNHHHGHGEAARHATNRVNRKLNTLGTFYGTGAWRGASLFAAAQAPAECLADPDGGSQPARGVRRAVRRRAQL